MKGINEVRAMGNLGRDAEIRQTHGGTAVATFSIGCSFSVKDQSAPNGWRESTEWIKVCCWSPSDWLCKQLKKGRPVHVAGRLQTRSWEKNGEKRYSTEVVCQNSGVIPVNPIRADQTDNQSAQRQPQQAQPADQYPGAEESQGPPAQDDDEIPFAFLIGAGLGLARFLPLAEGFLA